MVRVEKHLNRSTRSRPVSCLFCRSRKLRCSRQFPCANCTSRGLSCELDGHRVPSTTSLEENLPDEGSSKGDILERLRRLEDIVIGQGGEPPISASGQASQEKASQAWQKGYSSPLNTEKSPAIDVDWLEGEVTYSVPTDSLVTHGIEFKTCSIRQITNAASMSQNSHDPIVATRCIWLPFHNEARQIINKYLTDITYIHHVVHSPTVLSVIDELYNHLSENGDVNLGHVSLLLAILASTTFFWTERDMNLPLFPSVEQANQQASVWLQASLDVQEFSRRRGMDCLEDVQAMIIIGFLIANLVGIAPQAWYVFSSAISVARRLSLHRIDHPHNGNINVPHPNSVQAEIGRRVWWYLAATDWQFSQFAGPQKGTYSINPQHMATKLPLNASDEDLMDGTPTIDKPMNQPTSMSYSLQRIRLAELCRETSDSMPFAEIGHGIANYQHVRDIDERLCRIMHEMPAFFSLDYNPDEISKNDSEKSPGIIIQRYVINSLLYTQRCRLHLPYLSRATEEPEYAFSKNACLQAARMVIRTERLLAIQNIPFVLKRLKFSGVIHCVCMAIIVLLMDICLHKSIRSEDDRERREEIYNAFDILEEAKGQSPFAEQILQSFYATLWRNKVPLPSTRRRKKPRIENHDQQLYTESIDTPTTSTSFSAENTEIDPSDLNLSSFDDLWQTLDNNVDSSSFFNWNSLFAELDSPFLSL
ncbi:hypothetical protein N7456_010110 [Penicillium angulare]|uniref:Zn(2)-C6 fungal-type domain-containing protein n=1 Tax=Penicillium angulare TaxID=116970 RepID=A0A9W9F672_9EURO|nr:hypothetical protein N7456_010110 [Penicillium angulare]